MENTNLKLGAKIKVHGFIMLKGLQQGNYIVTEIDNISYTFKKANGKKLCRHYKNSIEGAIKCFERCDNNGIEIINN
jgi:hypothetical protein